MSAVTAADILAFSDDELVAMWEESMTLSPEQKAELDSESLELQLLFADAEERINNAD